MRRMILLAPLVLGSCATPAPQVTHESSFNASLKSIEGSTGGRLGVALVNREGNVLGAMRADERFAFCSTYKLLLAGLILDGSRRGDWSLGERLAVTKDQLTTYSPVSEQHLGRGWMTIEEAAEAIVTVSDNGAANLLLRRAGGPKAFNRWLAAHGDATTRLDRFEPDLNENAVDDPRDTTNPVQFARSVARLVLGDWLHSTEKQMLREWLVESKTGLSRIRAGIPKHWVSGDKTGTCGGEGQSYNDAAFFVPDAQADAGFVLVVFLDRPSVNPEKSNSALADVARKAAALTGH
jgi:beta-lactamase class A